ncbi:MAG: DNA polymerase III subunit gamma/tau [Bryobacteraceae bacterium]|nr:DNA polymerase III subunit gamma/tau [Bryobacteraceae bacterium]
MSEQKAYQVIARKYRPQGFEELIGQEAVRTTIENAIGQKRIAHGYIFAGQRGTGKTTVARILARCLNCEKGPTPTPCNVCASCKEVTLGNSMDVIEIDAASNRGINEMRELRENVRFRPARDRYKVFIVDEAHQITSEAFNALLKTLEEPPEWVVFLMCTTESHKIPVTIASRCQQFTFRSVDFDDLVARMRDICQQENVEADDEALAVLAQAGEGSVRDSLSALDQAIAACGRVIRGSEVRALLGRFSLDALSRVSDALAKADSAAMLEIVAELERTGQSLQHFCRELSRYFRNLLVTKVAGADTRLIGASPSERERFGAVAATFSEEDLTRYLQLTLDLFKDLQYSLQPRLHMELGLIRLVQAGRLTSIEQLIATLGGGGTPVAPPPPPPAAKTPPPPPARMAAPPQPPPEPKAPPPEPKAPPPAPVEATPLPNDANLQQRLHAALVEMGSQYTADAVENSSVEEVNGEFVFVTPKTFTLSMKGPDLPKALAQVLGRPARLKLTVGEPAVSATVVKKAKPAGGEQAESRALANTEVQRFQELFPGSQVRQVRDLSDY